MNKNIMSIFLDKLIEFPLWVKQIIYLRLYQNLSTYLSEDFVNLKEESIFHLYIPVLSFLGRTELAEKKGGFDANIYNFLANAAEGLSILEISMNNFWTMEEVAKYFIFCIEQNYIKIPDVVYIEAMAGFMSGKYRTGEYFKRIGKIDVDQLEQVIIRQSQLTKTGNRTKIAEIMISLGYITEKDTSSLLRIKDESKKRFILDSAIVPHESKGPVQDVEAYKIQIAKLTEQNNLLRDRLSKILAFVKKQ